MNQMSPCSLDTYSLRGVGGGEPTGLCRVMSMSVGQTPDQETPEEEPVLQKGKGKRELKRQLFSSEIRGDIAEISAR